MVAPLLYPWRESLGYDRVAWLILLVVELCNCTMVCISHILLFATIFSNDSLVRKQIFLPGISAVIFKKPVQMGSRFGPDLVQIWSRFGPDLVQISRSRPSGPISATTQYIQYFKQSIPFWNNMSYSTYIGIQY